MGKKQNTLLQQLSVGVSIALVQLVTLTSSALSLRLCEVSEGLLPNMGPLLSHSQRHAGLSPGMKGRFQ